MLIEKIGTVCFVLALLHSFFGFKLVQFAKRFKKSEKAHHFLHFFAEIEFIFGIWGGVFILLYLLAEGAQASGQFLQSLKLTEPVFVFMVMLICSTKPVMDIAERIVVLLSTLLNKLLKVPTIYSEIFVILSFGALAGSFITEPAAMTLSAMLLVQMIHTQSAPLIYSLIAVLFVNVSIGGALTAFAAPPIIMVAHKWGWTSEFVFNQFAWKVLSAVFINSLMLIVVFRKQLTRSFYTIKKITKKEDQQGATAPLWVTVFHFVFLYLAVKAGHNQQMMTFMLIMFLALFQMTKPYQDKVRYKESFMVCFFLMGLVILGPFQKWWLQPIISNMTQGALFTASTLLTSVTDNAALTFLGSQIENLSDLSKYALVAGAIAGGGLTIIANAPNPAGYTILQNKFPNGNMNHFKFLLFAIPPTLIAIIFLSIGF